MQIKKAEGYRPIEKSAVRFAGTSCVGRSAPQDGYYDHFTVSSPASQDRGSFRDMVASLSYQVRTCNTTGKIQELRRQVSSGEYQIKARETAARMLLMMEDAE